MSTFFWIVLIGWSIGLFFVGVFVGILFESKSVFPQVRKEGKQGQINELQQRIDKWARSWGRKVDSRNMGLGVCEEAGEMAHCLLKRNQGLRGMDKPEVFVPECTDAIGDIMVYLAELCTAEGWNLEHIFVATVDKVTKRKWKDSPEHAAKIADGEDTND